MATKEQERNALKKIRKIVDELGEDSYIGFAFEGCFELAEQNIENDFALSPKARIESADERESKLTKKVERLTAEVKSLKSEMTANSNSFLDQIDVLRRQTLSVDVLEELRTVMEVRLEGIELDLQTAANNVVELAEHPSSMEFNDAVRTHRAIKEDYAHNKLTISLLSNCINNIYLAK